VFERINLKAASKDEIAQHLETTGNPHGKAEGHGRLAWDLVEQSRARAEQPESVSVRKP